MKRMRGSDAFMVYNETPTSPFVTLKVAIYRPAAHRKPPDTADIVHYVQGGIAAVGGSRAGLRIVRVPFDLHHPVWIRDPDFSPDKHVSTATLPAPGDKTQLCDYLSELMSEPLYPDRPPWEVRVVTGLEGGRVAVVFKIHHALADGKTFADLLVKGHSLTREDLQAIPAENEVDAIPGRAKLIRDALADLARNYSVELPGFYRHLQAARKRSAAFKAKQRAAAKSSTGTSAAPYTLFDSRGEHDRRRHYRYQTFALSDFKALGKNFDCTINTLVLGVCSETLRRYLLEQDALPSQPLITSMPVGDPEETDLQLLHSDIHNNRVAVAYLPLYQNIEDFGERLQAIKAAAQNAILDLRGAEGRRFDNYLDFVPGPLVRGLLTVVAQRTEKQHKPFANLIISNVPGPRETLYALDGRLELEELASTGNLMDAQHLNITVWSYVDKLTFSFYSRKHALPQPDRMLDHMRDVVAELTAAHVSRSPPATRRSRRSPGTPRGSIRGAR